MTKFHIIPFTVTLALWSLGALSSEIKADPGSLADANAKAQAGDTVVLADGDYKAPIAPQNSGEPGRPIVFKAANRHKVKYADPELNGAVQLQNKAYIAIEGIVAKNLRRCIVSEGSHHVTINDCDFSQAAGTSAWECCRFRECGDGIVFTNNQVTGGNDLLAIWKGAGHRIEGNFFGDALHTGLVLVAVQRSVVRGNRFLNRQWKCMEVFSDRTPPAKLSRYNLIEGNRFEYSPSSSIQYAGNDSILRHNIFWRVRNGMNFAHYLGKAKTPEAWYNSGNRFYNNVIADCGNTEINDKLIAEAEKDGFKVAEASKLNGAISYGLDFATNLHDKDRPYGDQAIVNNILFRNNTGKGTDLAAPTVQVAFDWDATPAVASFFNNCFGSGKPGSKLFYWLDANHEKPPQPNSQSLKEFEEHYPNSCARNLDADPAFVDPDAGDFHLKAGSPCKDAGACLTRAKGAGEGTALAVQDARWFCDGFGIEGVEGDQVQLEGQQQSVKIVKVDYEKNILTLSAPLKWTDGQGVALAFVGKAPDIGAFEIGSMEPKPAAVRASAEK